MSKYMVRIEQNPDYWKGHYRAVAYERNEDGQWNPIRILGEGSQEDAEQWEKELRVRYSLEGKILVTHKQNLTQIWGQADDGYQFFLVESDDDEVIARYLHWNDYQLIEREKPEYWDSKTHYLCGTYRKV